MLIDNTRVPFTDIAKKLLISAGTVHVRVKKWKMLESFNGFFIDIRL
jgi:DNA-binding Lrp family transcriptional regulator